jgi:hypothetical protein
VPLRFGARQVDYVLVVLDISACYHTLWTTLSADTIKESISDDMPSVWFYRVKARCKW